MKSIGTTLVADNILKTKSVIFVSAIYNRTGINSYAAHYGAYYMVPGWYPFLYNNILSFSINQYGPVRSCSTPSKTSLSTLAAFTLYISLNNHYFRTRHVSPRKIPRTLLF